jgi:ribosomal-protein-alanine N-acetyltransferase
MTAGGSIDPKYVSLLWAGPERAAEIAALHAQLFEPPWDEPAILALLDHPAATSLVALVGQPKVAVGFVLGQIAADEAEILSVGVAKEWQQKGLGHRLIEGFARAVMRADAKRLFLEVAADNVPALMLYRGLGFTNTGCREGYYARGNGSAVDALNLALAL